MAPSTSLPSPPSKPASSWRALLAAGVENVSNDPGHPARIALRTYSLCLSLSLGPVLLPVILAPALRPESFRSRARVLLRALSRELQLAGFASAITIAVAGGATLQRFWDSLERPYTHQRIWLHSLGSKVQRAFLTNVITSTIAVTLLRWRRHGRLGAPPPTLDLSLLLLVRALDALVQAFILQKTRLAAARHVQAPSQNGAASRPSVMSFATRTHDKQSEELAKVWKNTVVTCLDALVFWASSARIMWCFFYQPRRLPRSYVKWINSLANADDRLLEVLRAIREGRWSYIHRSTKQDILGPLAEELGHPSSWGDPAILPAYGGNLANEVWKKMEADGRSGVGGLPCELVHGGIGVWFGLDNSCTANAAIRAAYAFAEALVVYLPVHFLPILLTRPSSVMRLHRSVPVLLSAVRSAAFLSTFLSSYWFAVCFTRTLVLARLFPNISHDVWDGPYGCTLAGSLACGASIWIENAKRRGEMALYVLPKALRASIPRKWLRSRHPAVQFVECLTIILSLASLLTFSVHQPEALRGLSRWTLAFVMKGPNTGLWKRRKKEIHTPPNNCEFPH